LLLLSATLLDEDTVHLKLDVRPFSLLRVAIHHSKFCGSLFIFSKQDARLPLPSEAYEESTAAIPCSLKNGFVISLHNGLR
jgi:hypothetical protein